jgi:hypothetical protein
MHNNPCKGKWNLAPSPKQYKHSSAHFYLADEQGYYPVTSYMELKDVDFDKTGE